MRIHTTEKNQSVSDISKIYGISEENIRNINGLNTEEPATGEELLILLPTRTYRVQYGDTPEKISMRFGIRKKDIMAFNPWLNFRDMKIGENITLGYCERKYGMRVANGCFYKDCTEEKLIEMMPYLTYVTFASAVAEKSGIKKTFNDKRLVKMVNDEGKIPLIRVYDRYTDRYKSKGDYSEFAYKLIEVAKDGDYKGIMLNSSAFSHSAENFIDFLMILRKRMIGCDLILINEINEITPAEFSEYADGSVFYYPKCAMADELNFDCGERKVLGDYSCQSESAKAFVDIPTVALAPKGYTDIETAIKKARSGGYNIERNENTLLSHFTDKNQGEYKFMSLHSLRKLYELIHEFDYMGICFDIMRTPISFVMMYNALFKTSYHAYIRSREGCSRASEE